MWEEYYPKIGYHFPWVGYFVFKDEKIAGTCGFTGKPQNRSVEISYCTFKEFEGKGISTFSGREMIAIAKASDTSLKITAKTAPEENASVSILKKNGFEFSAVVRDHEIGDAWEWQLKK
jgi:ribosomal-protein-alanine N-acetyltransferase